MLGLSQNLSEFYPSGAGGLFLPQAAFVCPELSVFFFSKTFAILQFFLSRLFPPLDHAMTPFQADSFSAKTSLWKGPAKCSLLISRDIFRPPAFFVFLHPHFRWPHSHPRLRCLDRAGILTIFDPPKQRETLPFPESLNFFSSFLRRCLAWLPFSSLRCFVFDRLYPLEIPSIGRSSDALFGSPSSSIPFVFILFFRRSFICPFSVAVRLDFSGWED